MDNQREAYREEAKVLLVELEALLPSLEENPEDQERIDQVFRAIHTIEGSGSMFGFYDVSAFIHHVEIVYHLVRDGRIPVTGDLVDLTHAALDQIKSMVNEEEIDMAGAGRILYSFKEISKNKRLPFLIRQKKIIVR